MLCRCYSYCYVYAIVAISISSIRLCNSSFLIVVLFFILIGRENGGRVSLTIVFLFDIKIN